LRARRALFPPELGIAAGGRKRLRLSDALRPALSGRRRRQGRAQAGGGGVGLA
jgi:hypothetical protein